MIITVNLLFRVITLVLFFLWWLYWRISKKTAEQKNPSSKSKIYRKRQFQQFVLRIAQLIMILQVIGVNILPLPFSQFVVQSIGFIFVFIGSFIAISARKTLGNNWANAYAYQIKKQQELVTNGIYSLIRHPIYSGLCLAFIGGELIAQSYLIVIGFALSIGAYWQARQEEKLLIEHFGKAYKTYMKHTKMFIPFLW